MDNCIIHVYESLFEGERVCSNCNKTESRITEESMLRSSGQDISNDYIKQQKRMEEKGK